MIWFLVLVISHSDIGHLNSAGVSASVQYLAMPSEAQCRALAPQLRRDAEQRLQNIKADQGGVEYVVTASCVKF